MSTNTAMAVKNTHMACTDHTLKKRSVFSLIASNRESLPSCEMRANRNQPRRTAHSSVAADASSGRSMDDCGPVRPPASSW